MAQISRRNLLLGGLSLVVAPSIASSASNYQPIETQFLAALGDPLAKSGDNAQMWGLWTKDPGPRGVRLKNYEALVANNGVAPAEWKLDQKDWWLEEHGLIMEQPVFGVAPGKYVVTGDRAVMTTLTIHPKGSDGKQHWELAGGAVLYDVTHLRCRSARYTPATTGGSCTPANASQDNFPVDPGAAMPPVGGCNKVDYAVLFIVGMES
jgi:hypothetical protein